MFVVLGIKIAKAEGPVRHFFEKRSGAIPFIQNGKVDAISKDENANQERRRKDQQSLDKDSDRLGQHPAQLMLPLEGKKRANLPVQGIEPSDLEARSVPAELVELDQRR